MTIEGSHARAVLDGLRAFYEAPPVAEPGDGPAAALALFHEVAERVPAYRALLAEHGIDPAGVRTVADFARLPLLTKDNYLRRYALPELCRDGRLQDAETVAVSSGSSGRPTVWPRTVLDELAVARRFEHALSASFRADERRTLVVVCFPLGSWVGGMYTAAACRHLAAKGYPLTVATPGNNVDEILRVVAELGPFYDQVVLAGYPPFLKIVIDAGAAWERYVAPGALPPSDATALLAEALRADLRRLNSEFANYVPAGHQTPVVELRPAGDPEYFPVGVKHRYTRP